MNFDDEMKDVQKAELGGNYIKTGCVEIVTLKSYKMSPTDASFTGCPYIEVTFETLGDEKGENKNVNSSRLYRVRSTDGENSKEWKLKRIKELFANAGADWSLGGEATIKSAMGKKVKALFKEVEYIGVNANLNNKPEIKTKVEYSFSAKSDDVIKGNQSYLRSNLNETDQAKLAAELEKWNRDNPVGGNNTPIVLAEPVSVTKDGVVDDLPF
tara:strand:- start:326 stop:964 length:639 start_codon:yes stop_codon:yes gene_type:complete